MSDIENMWSITWEVPFEERDNLTLKLEALDDQIEAISSFESPNSAPSGFLDDDGLPIAQQHIVVAYARINPITIGNLKPILDEYSHTICTIQEDANWFQPIPPKKIGRFWIDATGSQNPECFTLQIPGATAFGTGDHPTTIGCLTLLDQLEQDGCNPEYILDLGCGSGILAIACCNLWPKAHVWASDIDPESIRITNRHIELNKTKLTALVSQGFEQLPKDKTFDLIVANILMQPLIDMMHQMLCKNLILSGFLAGEQTEKLIQAYQDFEIVNRFDLDGWVALHLRKK